MMRSPPAVGFIGTASASLGRAGAEGRCARFRILLGYGQEDMEQDAEKDFEKQRSLVNKASGSLTKKRFAFAWTITARKVDEPSRARTVADVVWPTSDRMRVR